MVEQIEWLWVQEAELEGYLHRVRGGLSVKIIFKTILQNEKDLDMGENKENNIPAEEITSTQDLG